MPRLPIPARGKKLSYAQLGMAILRNFNADKAPEGFPISQILSLFKPSSTNSNSDRNDRMKLHTDEKPEDIWRVLCVEGMWFQDLFNYDFRRTEMCVIPYGTQEGEISFCAYNTGVGWRQIIENMHKNREPLASGMKSTDATPPMLAGHEVPGIAGSIRSSLPIIQAVLAEDLDEKPAAAASPVHGRRRRIRHASEADLPASSVTRWLGNFAVPAHSGFTQSLPARKENYSCES